MHKIAHILTWTTRKNGENEQQCYWLCLFLFRLENKKLQKIDTIKFQGFNYSIFSTTQFCIVCLFVTWPYVVFVVRNFSLCSILPCIFMRCNFASFCNYTKSKSFATILNAIPNHFHTLNNKFNVNTSNKTITLMNELTHNLIFRRKILDFNIVCSVTVDALLTMDLNCILIMSISLSKSKSAIIGHHTCQITIWLKINCISKCKYFSGNYLSSATSDL